MFNPCFIEGDGLAERRRFLSAAGALACAGFATAVAGPQVAEAAGQVDLAVFPKKRLGVGDVLRPEKTALIIVDMINRFCDAKWMSGGSEEGAKRIAADLKVIIASIRKTLDAFRERGALVVHVVNAKWTRDGRDAVSYQRGRDFDLFDTPAMSVIDELRPLPSMQSVSLRRNGTGVDQRAASPFSCS